MSISAAEVNKLRQMTGAGLMDCKQALSENNGDFEAAIDFLRKKGAKIAAKRADREATEGAVVAKTNSEGTVGVVIVLSCETDFVAKNEGFVSFAHEIADTAIAHKPATAEALKALTVGSVTLEARLMEEVAKIGEKIDVVKYEIIEGANLVPYIHGANRMGVLVELSNAPSEANIAAGKLVKALSEKSRLNAPKRQRKPKATIENKKGRALDKVKNLLAKLPPISI